ncbi:cell division protein ZapE [Aquipuribacter nitratireducens]|uniref:Cell division protein ZapE n=1 Tax=Aquipuribacter nitratireducens TaxID=650104 RepID=A0ABW0GRA0_9MICO
MNGQAERLVDRRPALDRGRLLDDLVPPPRFAGARFDTYVPDPAEPSQAAARSRLEAFAASTGATGARGGRLARLLGRRTDDATPRGVYLDGGFGVGKTHLLAATWHAAAGRRHYGTFVEYTNLAGALGFRGAVDALAGADLVCVDEFELDDPGDTVLMARLMRELADSGTRLAATSNTLPDALGAGRFAAEDFLREIQALGRLFEVATVDGEDYRHRGAPQAPGPADEAELDALAARPGAVVDDFPALCDHLADVHPSRYGAMLDGVAAVGWRDVRPVPDQNVALRLVVLADRLYDRSLPLVAGGRPLTDLFTTEMLRGGYRKKYLRALSRLTALAREASPAER